MPPSIFHHDSSHHWLISHLYSLDSYHTKIKKARTSRAIFMSRDEGQISVLPPSMAVDWKSLLGNCSSVTAPRQLLLRCPTTVHSWTYALPYYPTSCTYALPYCRPSMDILHFPHSPQPYGSAENSSCIFRTPHIHVGRMSQRARDGGVNTAYRITY